MGKRLDHRAEIIEMVCEALGKGNKQEAAELVRSRYPFDPPVERRRSISKLDRTRVFLRDGFIDRYSGDRLFFPPVLETISMSIPDDFPSHPNGKMATSHVAHWELYALGSPSRRSGEARCRSGAALACQMPTSTRG